ncbi:hypothetical protein GCM10009596_23530 [Arthrobacter rhombi]|uniref:YfjI family protein n=1 Tax=Arthrobacter rhombi TaxID=71253 RepID=UPI0031CE5CDE
MDYQYDNVLEARVAAESITPAPLQSAPRPPSFPANDLPKWWKDYVLATAEATQTPVDMVATVTLGIMAACVGGKAVIEPTPGWIEPLNLYTVAAMEPGNRKSSVFASCTKPLRDFEDLKISEARPYISEQAARKKLREDRAETVRKQVIGGKATEEAYLQASREADEIVVPPLPRILADDATPEALTSLAADNGGKIVVASAEGGIFDIFAGRYSGAPNMEILLKGHAGDEMRVDRKGRESETLPSVTLGFILTVQPSVLREIGRQPVEKSRGELERFLYSIPGSFVGYRKVNPAAVPTEVAAAYYERVQELVGRLYDNQEPDVLTFGPEAAYRFNIWQEAVETDLRPDGQLGSPRLIGWGSKLAGTTARFAGIHHLASGRPASEPISADSVDCAATMAEYFIEHAIAAFYMMSFTNPHAKAQTLLKLIRKGGVDTFTVRELMMRASRSVFPDVETIQQELNLLAEHEWVLPIQPESREGAGRKPSPRFVAHPSIFIDPNHATESTEYTESHSVDYVDYVGAPANRIQESA